MKKRAKKGYAWMLAVLAVLLVMPGLIFLQTQAAVGIDAGRECSLTVSVGIGDAGGDNSAYLEDFNQMSIPVSVYRVADVDVTGQRFTGVDPFTGLDFGKINSGSKDVTAADWQALAEQAKRIQEEKQPKAAGNVVIQNGKAAGGDGQDAGAGQMGETAQGTITGLTPGMYLVVPESAYNPDYTVQYTFAPYLTALPSSSYTLEGEGSDAWEYDLTVGLKPDAEPQYGRLNITKELTDYNETLGRTTFVFQIVGVDKDGVVKYEEVESMTFASPESQTITIENIPAGLTVTVTEVYSGASYTVDGPSEDTVLIWSEEAVRAQVGEEAAAAFKNRYGGGNRGGYGVTNHFESDGNGGWIWENPTDQPEE